MQYSTFPGWKLGVSRTSVGEAFIVIVAARNIGQTTSSSCFSEN